MSPEPFDHVFAAPEQIEQMTEVRRLFHNLYETLQTLPSGYQRTYALHRLEESAMWANKSITHFHQEVSRGR